MNQDQKMTEARELVARNKMNVALEQIRSIPITQLGKADLEMWLGILDAHRSNVQAEMAERRRANASREMEFQD